MAAFSVLIEAVVADLTDPVVSSWKATVHGPAQRDGTPGPAVCTYENQDKGAAVEAAVALRDRLNAIPWKEWAA